MGHTIVTYTVKPGRERENAALVHAVFEELAEARPAGCRYAVFQSTDSREFIHLYTDDGPTPGAPGGWVSSAYRSSAARATCSPARNSLSRVS
jgi:hypothetical protein